MPDDAGQSAKVQRLRYRRTAALWAPIPSNARPLREGVPKVEEEDEGD